MRQIRRERVCEKETRREERHRREVQRAMKEADIKELGFGGLG